MKFRENWLLALAVTVLSACGGGGGGGGVTSPASTQSAEGLWQGTTTDGYNITAAVLENGEIWALASSSSGVVGFINGTSSVSGTSISGVETSYNLVSHTYAQQNFTGTFNPKSTLSITASNGSFNSAYVTGYDQSSTPLATLAGTYSGWLASVGGAFSPSSVVTISSNGAISSSGAPCNATGTITPRASGKNVYNVSIGFSGVSCTAASMTLTGIAAYDNASGVLVVLSLNGAKTDGLVYSATKQSNVASTFPLRSGYQALLNQAVSNNYAITGTCSGSATENKSTAVSAIFEGAASYATTTTVTGTYVGCTPSSFASTSTSYYDSNYKPAGGSVSGSEYYVFTNAIDMPTSVVVGDTAQFGVIDVYSSSTKVTKTGTRVISYVVEPGTSSNNAVINIISKSYNLSNQLLSTQQSRYRITSTGQLTALSIDVQYSTTSTVHLVWTKY